jgi:hypothetical protein
VLSRNISKTSAAKYTKEWTYNGKQERTCASSLLEMVSKVNENDICNLIHNTHLNKIANK